MKAWFFWQYPVTSRACMNLQECGCLWARFVCACLWPSDHYVAKFGGPTMWEISSGERDESCLEGCENCHLAFSWSITLKMWNICRGTFGWWDIYSLDMHARPLKCGWVLCWLWSQVLWMILLSKSCLASLWHAWRCFDALFELTTQKARSKIANFPQKQGRQLISLRPTFSNQCHLFWRQCYWLIFKQSCVWLFRAFLGAVTEAGKSFCLEHEAFLRRNLHIRMWVLHANESVWLRLLIDSYDSCNWAHQLFSWDKFLHRCITRM